MSRGIALLRLDDPDMEQLLTDADQAMYEAKRAGKRCYRIAGSTAQASHEIAA